MTRIAYHFTGDTLRDGRPVPAVGEVLRHDGPIEWCKSGLYAAPTAWDALEYAPGPMLHLVECDEIEREEGVILKSFDATYLLRRFAADQALSVAHLWDMPDIVRDYLTTLDETKRDAAWDAAWAAAWAAAWDTTQNTTWAAAWDAARAAARATAWDAARAAARAAAWAATRADFNARVAAQFNAMEDTP